MTHRFEAEMLIGKERILSLFLQVDVFFSRDLDSRLSEREAAVVTEFLATKNAHLHVMRDHSAHSTQIMGGMWGVNKLGEEEKVVRDTFNSAFEKLLKVCENDSWFVLGRG